MAALLQEHQSALPQMVLRICIYYNRSYIYIYPEQSDTRILKQLKMDRTAYKTAYDKLQTFQENHCTVECPSVPWLPTL